MSRMISSARTSMRASRRRRVIVVPRPPPYARTPRFAMTAIERSLNIPSKERTPVNVEAIFSMMKTWPNFTSFIKKEEIQKDICGSVFFEKYKNGELLFKPGDLSDGWYFVFRGGCILVEETEEEPQDPNEIVPDEYRILFRDLRIRKIRHFRVVKHVSSTQDFGREELQKMTWRKYYCVTVGDTELIKIDPYTFKYFSDQYKYEMIEKKSEALNQVRNFECLVELTDINRRLADAMKECTVDQGFVISRANPIAKGFLVVEKGLIIVKRKVDFSQITLTKEDVRVGDTDINVPTGVEYIQSDRITEHGILALPEMYETDPFDFYAEVMQDTECYLILYKDFFAYIPIALQKEILPTILDQRSEEEVVRDWLKMKKQYQWRLFKKKCEVEASDFNKATRNGPAEDIYARLPRLPISLPSYKPRGRRSVRITSTI